MPKKFEYKFFSDYIFTGELSGMQQLSGKKKEINFTNWTEDSLNNMGKDGWELVSVVPQSHSAFRAGTTDSMLWVFKREVSQ